MLHSELLNGLSIQNGSFHKKKIKCCVYMYLNCHLVLRQTVVVVFSCSALESTDKILVLIA